MPIVVDPLFTPPAPPSGATSPDGRLTAVVDDANTGCLLRASFAEQVLRRNLLSNPSFVTDLGLVEVRRNLAANPVRDDVSSAAGIQASRGTMSVGSGYLRLTVTDASLGAFAQRFNTAPSDYLPVAPTEPVTISADCRTNTGSRMGAMLIWLDASNAVVGSTTTGQYVTPDDTGWVRASVTASAPSGATKFTWYVGTENAGGSVQVGEWMDVRHILIEKAKVALPYFDALTPADPATGWVYEAGSSYSVQKAPKITGTGNLGPYAPIVGGRGSDGVLRLLYKGDAAMNLWAFHGLADVPCEPGDLFAATLEVRQVGGTGPTRVRPQIGQYSPNFSIYVAGLPANADVELPVGGAWVPLPLRASAEVTGTGTVRLMLYSSAGVPPAGTIIEVRNTRIDQVEAVGDELQGGPFDGSTPDGDLSYRWTGADDASSSEEFAPAVVDGDGELPSRVRFLRGDSTVRSGDPAEAPGGKAVAYDHEAGWGRTSLWSAVPIFRDGSEGEPSMPVAATLPEDLAVLDDLWIKSVAEPSLSLRATVIDPLPQMSLGGRQSFSSVPGDGLPVATWDVHSGYEFALRVLTETAQQRAAMEALLDSGTLLLQTTTAVDLEDLFVVPGDVSWAWVNDSRDPSRVWTIAATRVGRPGTVQAPLRIPGRTCDDVIDTYASCATLLAQVPSCYALLGA